MSEQGPSPEQQQQIAEMQAAFESIQPTMAEVQEAMQSGDPERIKAALEKLKALIDKLKEIAATEGLPPEARQQAAQVAMQLEAQFMQIQGQLEG
jgi:DNA repair exonuclease SbcCD ATPase subunit